VALSHAHALRDVLQWRAAQALRESGDETPALSSSDQAAHLMQATARSLRMALLSVAVCKQRFKPLEEAQISGRPIKRKAQQLLQRQPKTLVACLLRKVFKQPNVDRRNLSRSTVIDFSISDVCMQACVADSTERVANTAVP
jgi:hypothetical protein